MPWRQENNRTPPSLAARRNARTLRRNMTDPERKLWWHLRYRLCVEGTHFRKQMAIGPYIADFCCLGARLVVEVDGEHHGGDAMRMADSARTAFLNSEGFRVLRFSNREVVTEIDVVLDTILAATSSTTPTPGPSPQGGGER